MLQFFFDDISPHYEYFRNFIDIRPIYNEKPDMGKPTKTDNMQMTLFLKLINIKRLNTIP